MVGEARQGEQGGLLVHGLFVFFFFFFFFRFSRLLYTFVHVSRHVQIEIEILSLHTQLAHSSGWISLR